MIDYILNEVSEVTPEKGYVICEFDDYAPMGEKLTILQRANTWAEAQAIQQAFGNDTLIYGDRDDITPL